LGGHRYHKKKVKLRKPKSIASKTKNVKHQKQKVAPSGPEYYKNKHLGDQGRKEGGSRKEGRKEGWRDGWKERAGRKEGRTGGRKEGRNEGAGRKGGRKEGGSWKEGRREGRTATVLKPWLARPRFSLIFY